MIARRFTLGLLLLLVAATVSAQAINPLARTVNNGTTDPTFCRPTAVNVFFNRTTPAFKVCTAANTWTALLSNGGSGTATGGFNVTDGNFQIKGQQIQAFYVGITNTAGVIQHRILGDSLSGGTIGNFAGKVNGASFTFANTPSVAAGVGFTSGGGIDAANTNFFYLDTTAAQVPADFVLSSVIVTYNDTTTVITVDVGALSINVNGVTRVRPLFVFRINATGAAFAINTTNIATGKSLTIKFNGYIL